MALKDRPLDTLLKEMEKQGGTISRADLLQLLSKHELAIVRRPRREKE